MPRIVRVFIVFTVTMAGMAGAQPISPTDEVPDRASHTTVYDPVNDKIYMIGGTPTGNVGSNVNLCQRYDPDAETWATMSPMFTPRGWITSGHVRGRLYVLGGYSNTGTALAVNEEYTIAVDSWATREPLPVAVIASMSAVWRDSLVYVMGGMSTDYNGIDTVQVYDPFAGNWALGSAMPRPADMSGPAVIVGDTIYISDAYDRAYGQMWGRMLKGAINPVSPTQITWLWGPSLPDSMGSGGKGTVSLRNKIYAFGLGRGLRLLTGCAYDPALGAYTESLPSLRLERGGGLRGEVVVARETADEFYQIAGAWTSGGGSSYHKLHFTPQAVAVAGSEAVPAYRLRMSTVFRNGVRIHYEIGRPGRATLIVYDQLGRTVRALVSGQTQVGRHAIAWDGRDERGRPVGGGVYFCRLQTGEFAVTKKTVKTE